MSPAEVQRCKQVCVCITDDDADGIIKPEGETWKQFNRLCLATFDKQG